MYRVKIKNIIDERKWEAQFSTLDEAKIWLSQQQKKSGRIPDHKISKLLVDASGNPLLDAQNQKQFEEIVVPAEADFKIENISNDFVLLQKQFDAKKYLAATDWYIIRNIEKGIAVPEEIIIKRQAAREIL